MNYNLIDMDQVIQNIADALLKAFGDPRVVVLLITIIPIVEARLAIPMGMNASLGLSAGEAFGYAFLGSCIIAPILLLVLIPFINWLSKTRVFKRVGDFLYDKFESKSRSIKTEPQSGEKKRFAPPTKQEWKKMGGVAAFVAVPLPLTGVWTGCAVASIIKLGFWKSLVSIITGNLVASGIITLLCYLFADYVDTITLIIGIIAIAVVLFLIVKFILYKPKKTAQDTDEKADADDIENADEKIADMTIDETKEKIADMTIDDVKENDTTTSPDNHEKRDNEKSYAHAPEINIDNIDPTDIQKNNKE